MEIDIEEKNYLSVTENLIGAVLIIHEPTTYPDFEIMTTTTQPNQEVNIALSANKIICSDKIRRLSLSKRKCVFLDEVRNTKQKLIKIIKMLH